MKPYVIVCTETWILSLLQFYGIDDYRIYYKKSCVNSADGVVIYGRADLAGMHEKIAKNS